MKNILLLVHDDAGQEARFQAALDVTRAVEGHLICVDISVLPVLVGDFYSGAGTAMLLADERQREADNRSQLEARLATEQVSWNWVEATGTIADCLRDASALADLIVVNRKLDDFPVPEMRSVAGEVVLKSHKPVLAVPDSSRGLNLSGRVLVCWDGSACATAALRAAVPLLQLAETVVLLEIEEGGGKGDVEEAAAYLSRSGIKPLVRRRGASLDRISTIILDDIRHERADYVVMGGFSHLRFTEALFGGVTRRMLTESPVPLLLAH